MVAAEIDERKEKYGERIFHSLLKN